MDLQTACQVIRDVYHCNEDFREAFISSIESALKESIPFNDDRSEAERIANRIIGD